MAVWYSVLYEVTWHEGRRGTGVCQYWTTVDGRNKLFASNLGNRSQPLRGQIYVLRPSQVHDTGAPWATLVVAGKARGRVTRVRQVDGGYTSGCGSPPPAFVPPPNDCRTAGLPSPTAGLLAGWAALPTPITLDYTKRDSSVDPDPEVVPLTRPVIFLSVGARPPFSRCPLPLEAPEHPSNFALRVTNAEWSKLRTLRFGRDVPRAQREMFLIDEHSGRCTRTVPAAECSFKVRLAATIRRTSP